MWAGMGPIVLKIFQGAPVTSGLAEPLLPTERAVINRGVASSKRVGVGRGLGVGGGLIVLPSRDMVPQEMFLFLGFLG